MEHAGWAEPFDDVQAAAPSLDATNRDRAKRPVARGHASGREAVSPGQRAAQDLAHEQGTSRPRSLATIRPLIDAGDVARECVAGIPGAALLAVNRAREEVERMCMRNLLADPEARVFFKDRESRFLLVNEAFLTALGGGRSLEELVDKTDFDIFSRPHAVAAFEDEQRVLATGEPILAKVERETFHDRPDAWVSTTKRPLLDAEGNIIGTWGISRDVTAQVTAEHALDHQALHDGLTGLSNRLLFDDGLSQALSANRRHKHQLAVLFLDLDNFKNINNSLGHAAGDEVLRVAAMRFSECLRPEDAVARVGGDEFVIALREIGEPQEASRAAKRLLDALRRPLTLAGQELIITASTGIALATHERQATAEELIRDADLAMSEAKVAGNGEVRFFEPNMRDSAVQRMELISDLRLAIDEGQFVIHYQPIVTLGEHAGMGAEAIVGAEALVRWNHPWLGLIPPGVFIGLAEETGLIGEIGGFVLAQACDELQRWRQTLDGCAGLFVTVNVSPLQLQSSRLVTEVETALQHAGLAPDHLVLEITESVVCDRDSDIARRFSELKQLGVRLAVDDFGTGYSTLSYLQSMPLDILKIDKSFVDGLAIGIDNDQLVAGIIDLAHRMHLQTLAEGIETCEQAQTLSAMKSELGQGYLFAEPLPAEQFEALLKTPVASPTSLTGGVPLRKHDCFRGRASL